MATENVAVLFTDIVGSTELSQRLSAEVADEVRRAHFSVLRQAITESGGTEVKNLGDGLMVVFSSASAALGCAVSMQQGIDQGNHAGAEVVGLRVGLSVGEASKEDGDYFGDPVVEAARLCAQCGSGQILATDLVRAMAGRRSRHDCQPLGELELKGLLEPVEVVEVLWEPLGRDETGIRIPLPGRLAARPPVGVVGRGAEATTIADAVKRVAGGDGREVMIVSGEAGLGKTTLAAESARAAFDGGACVLFGHCEEDLATPYQLFAEALGHYVTHAPETQLLAHVEAHGSELSRLVPALHGRIPDLPPSRATDSDTERFLLFAAVVGLLAMMSEVQPVVLVLDDLQWADNGSLLLLRHLASADRPMRVLVLGTYRDTELSRTHPLTDTLAALHRLDGVSRIELVGLDDSGVVSFLEAAAGQSLDNAVIGVAHAIFRETDGNPFFVSEVLRHLSETGALLQDDTGRWVAAESMDQVTLPDSVRMVIGARVGRLGAEAERVLSVASVIGRDFDLDLLGRATKSDGDDLLDTLEAASAAALVREPADASGRYSFAHALIQHTLYEDLGPNRRAQAHRQVAEALEELCGGRPGSRVGELARHWVKATQPIDLRKAVDYSRQAGDAALAALAPADALGYYAQALELHGQEPEADPLLGLDLAIGLGTAQRLTGDPASRATLLDAARRADDLGDVQRLVAAALANDRGWYSTVGSIDVEWVEILELALALLPPDAAGRALVLATLCSEVNHGASLERRMELATEALAIAHATDDDATIVRVANNVQFSLQVPSLLDQSLARSADALARAERLGDPVLWGWAAHWRFHPTMLAGHVEEMDHSLEVSGDLSRQIGEPMVRYAYAAALSTRAQIAGDVERAERLAWEAFQFATDIGLTDSDIYLGMQIWAVSVQRGTAGELLPFFEQGEPGLPSAAQANRAMRALICVEGDRFDVAAQLLEEFAISGYELHMDSQWLTSMLCYADVAITMKAADHAAALFELLAPWGEQWCSSGITAEGPVSRPLGGLATVLGRYEEAEGYFAQSAAMSDRMGAKFFHASTELLWGLMLTERRSPGDNQQARERIGRARTSAAVNGYLNIERRASEALDHLN